MAKSENDGNVGGGGGNVSNGEKTDKIPLKLILVSGRTHEFKNFTAATTAGELINYVFEHWPEEWEEERVTSAQMLKLIFHGRFIHGSVTLGALHLPSGTSTVMHLVTRETLPEPNSNDNPKKSKRGRCCHCTIC
ncbi:Rad60-SLD_2 domain-containing protein [Meloidogyne graminicola]|uniref:Rad60-SLD_2 domain-containing protein n=1 Tax=Meloidogyne graminicola TaxID=189291 RepID=A0A8T0A154_9BILA|nr:Rad60-SLD_2 domain-containing protein [Meloidogyne graminicola]